MNQTAATHPAATSPAETQAAAKPTVAKLLYNKREAAYALGISVRSIENLLYSKQLSTRKCGRLVLIPAGDVQRVARREQLQGT